MHWEAGVAGDFVETLASRHSLLDHVVISSYYVICQNYNKKVIFHNGSYLKNEIKTLE